MGAFIFLICFTKTFEIANLAENFSTTELQRVP